VTTFSPLDDVTPIEAPSYQPKAGYPQHKRYLENSGGFKVGLLTWTEDETANRVDQLYINDSYQSLPNLLLLCEPILQNGKSVESRGVVINPKIQPLLQKLKERGRISNIFDPVQPELDQTLFNGTEPKPSVQKFITDLYHRAFQIEMGVWSYEGLVDLYITGSLTTYQYTAVSDLDISVFPNYDLIWQRLGMEPDAARKQLLVLSIEHLDGTVIPGTTHRLQFFVMPNHVMPSDRFKTGVRSGYSLDDQMWFTPPEQDRVHDIAEEMPEAYSRAAMMADKMTEMLDHDPDQAKELYRQIHKKRQIDQRAGLGDFSEGNIVYKYLAHEGLLDRIKNELHQHVAKIAEVIVDKEYQDYVGNPHYIGDPQSSQLFEYTHKSLRSPTPGSNQDDEWDSKFNSGVLDYEIHPEGLTSIEAAHGWDPETVDLWGEQDSNEIAGPFLFPDNGGPAIWVNWFRKGHTDDYDSNQTFELLRALEAEGLPIYAHVVNEKLLGLLDKRFKTSETVEIAPPRYDLTNLTIPEDWTESGWHSGVRQSPELIKAWDLGHPEIMNRMFSPKNITWEQARDWLADKAPSEGPSGLKEKVLATAPDTEFHYTARGIHKDEPDWWAEWFIEKMPGGYRNSKIAYTIERWDDGKMHSVKVKNDAGLVVGVLDYVIVPEDVTDTDWADDADGPYMVEDHGNTPAIFVHWLWVDPSPYMKSEKTSLPILLPLFRELQSLHLPVYANVHNQKLLGFLEKFRTSSKTGMALLPKDQARDLRIDIISQAAQLGVEVIFNADWGVEMGVLDGIADLHRITVPLVRHDVDYLIAMHELGHHALKQSFMQMDWVDEWTDIQEEAAVWKWAIEHSKIPVTQEMLDEAKQSLLSYEVPAINDALRYNLPIPEYQNEDYDWLQRYQPTGASWNPEMPQEVLDRYAQIYECPWCHSTMKWKGETLQCPYCGYEFPMGTQMPRTGMAADPAFVQKWIAENGPYVYHGIRPKVVGMEPQDAFDSIMAEGIKPDQRTDIADKPLLENYGLQPDWYKKWEPQEQADAFDADWQAWWLSPRPGHVFLVTDPSNAYGPYIAKVDLRKLDPARIKPDDDYWRDNIGDDTGDNTLGEHMNEIGWGDDPKDTEEGGFNHGVLAYEGVIPPDAIIGIWHGTSKMEYDESGRATFPMTWGDQLAKLTATSDLWEEKVTMKVIYDFENDRIILGTMATQSGLPDTKIIGEYSDGVVTLYDAEKQWISPSYFRRLWNYSYPQRNLKYVEFKREEGNYILNDLPRKRTMAERTGDPELDSLIEYYYLQDRENMESLRDPNMSAGGCVEMARDMANFLKEHGIAATTAQTERGDDIFPQELGYGDLSHPDDGPHDLTIVERPSGTYAIDWTASQYGYKEFPMVQRLNDKGWEREWATNSGQQ
jgi:rubrerythrin